MTHFLTIDPFLSVINRADFQYYETKKLPRLTNFPVVSIWKTLVTDGPKDELILTTKSGEKLFLFSYQRKSRMKTGSVKPLIWQYTRLSYIEIYPATSMADLK